MPITKDQIVGFVESKSYRPLRIRELAKGLEVPENEYRAFRRLVKDLMASGGLARLKGGRVGQPEKLNLKSGYIKLNHKGVGYFSPDDGSEEIKVPPDETSTALDSDRVMVRVKPRIRGRRPEAEVVKILKRARNSLVGTFHRSRYFLTVEPDDERIGRDIYVHDTGDLEVEEGQKVVVALAPWTNPSMNPQGKIVEVLGFPDEPGVDILSAIRKFDLPTEFPPEVTEEAEQVEFKLTEDDLRYRKDLRDTVTFTIDPVDAKDHDDAISVKLLPNGNYRLGVHIADVSHYVREGSPTDIEARARGTSVYLVDRVIPMLPEGLSNDVCSLREGEDRLTYSCIIEVSADGAVVKAETVPSIIRSRAKLSYNQVQEFFDSGDPPNGGDGLTESLRLMRDLAQILRKKRLSMGSLDFDLPEPRVILTVTGDVVDIRPRARKESHKLVEEFMLLANQVVAKQFTRHGLPILYRVHDVPDKERLENFQEFAKGFGWELKFTDPPKPGQLSRFLREIEGSEEEEILSEMLLRSLKKACYQPDNIGHFGLATGHYLHFTSPIRRYPDLLVHRLLKEVKNNKYPGERLVNIKRLLRTVGEHSSFREKLAEDAERETVKIKQAVYLSRHIGDVFEGVVSGVLSFGFFVRLKKFSAEGMVRLSTLNDDYYQVDDKKLSVTGSHTGNSYSLGDRIYVQIVSVDLDRYHINLRIVSNNNHNNNNGGKTKRNRRKRKKR